MRTPGTAATRWTSHATTATRSSPISFLEVSPQGAKRGEGGNARGLGAQHARAEPRRHEARVDERRLLLVAEARLRTGGDGEFLARLAGGGEAQLRRGHEEHLGPGGGTVIK